MTVFQNTKNPASKHPSCRQVLYHKCVCLVGKSFPPPVGGSCALAELPNCHIVPQMIFRDVMDLGVIPMSLLYSPFQDEVCYVLVALPGSLFWRPQNQNEVSCARRAFSSCTRRGPFCCAGRKCFSRTRTRSTIRC